MKKWVWQVTEWPYFYYDSSKIISHERKFIQQIGKFAAVLSYIHSEDKEKFIIEALSEEGLKSSEIEGEILERESLQSSIKKHLGLKKDIGESPKEKGMAALLCDVYQSYQNPLTADMLFNWHQQLMEFKSTKITVGKYRDHSEPMQVVSSRYDKREVFYEAPPSKRVPVEMAVFIDWFNKIDSSESILGKAALIHVYFECIHPFEHGNGRIGRALVEKYLSMTFETPLLLPLSQIIYKNQKAYYAALGSCNQSLDANTWVQFFVRVIEEAQESAIEIVNFLLFKTKLFDRFKGKINQRQEKALLRIFKEGPEGFKGGLSAEKYIAITKTSRATATRDLHELVSMQVLEKTGKLKHTRYWLIKTKL
ncbi:Filamentation induced by cAMP protein Fic (plasmid) [Legionella adelaidensis]|uniref:Filamentation induced by cAMP protein Fic n=1 Tax=Legionella adelaidensis TaxID=45056 RepID=A0A0W0R4F3_9GAMM|nr:DUF4172 domain-containing protein [Legionella adelaidensis]KTC65944.1 Filamentation induced by cAMP protein Fic [Legionella adelaidensis]VEH85564.1 Filamentation induced by cAMP protein Fic [Legionella adelaidensis]